VRGVGNAQTHTEGRGDLKVKSTVNRQTYNILLKNVLYIPTNQHKLLSLGRWDKAGGSYLSSQGKLTMNARHGVTVVTGTQIDNHLYRLDNFIVQPPAMSPIPSISHHSFTSSELTPTWDVWHQQYGNLSLTGLKTLLNEKLVTGLSIDVQSPKFDCAACVQAKQHVAPFPKVAVNLQTKPGKLTHMDLWGKYPVQSIHGNQYFHTFLDDSTRCPTVSFLKHKDDAISAIQAYVAYLKAHSLHPNALRCDQGAEFVNDSLKDWLRGQGIELQMTAPYSPSQNGTAEHLNHTLVELARAMLIAGQLLLFLWEYAIAHTAYLCERAPMKALPGKTPFEAWYGVKPYVSDLRELGTPVFVLLQGKKEPLKLMPWSKQQIFVSYADGSKSVKYYNPETRKVLILQNYHFLTNLPTELGTPDSPIHVDLLPAVLHEGDQHDGHQKLTTLQLGIQRNLKRQHEEPRTEDERTEENQIDSPQRKLQKRPPINYRRLQDPFLDEEDEDETYHIYTETVHQAILGTDDPKTVQQAKIFADWPEWEKAICVELDQLDRFGTRKLVDCPPDAIPIPNKWVFLKKYNTAGEVIKHKAQLVVKGCAQCPGFDYNDTFSPVVRLETIRAILALVPLKRLKMRQMDVKGAYLNGILKENVYMHQPDGFTDGTNRVCWLQKTLYGLKQSGCEWNKELDQRMESKGFNHLRLDPCV